MTFTKDWFSGNGKDWIKWLDRFIGKPNLHFLEIGCFEGRATIWLLEHILTNETCKITAIDTFEGSFEHKVRKFDVSNMYENLLENIEPYKNKVIVEKGNSQIVLRKFEPNSYNFIYVDGSHMACDVLEDTLLSWRLLKVGGVLIWDDYSWGQEFKDRLKTPRIAIDAFLEIFKGQYQVVSRDRQICIVKIL